MYVGGCRQHQQRGGGAVLLICFCGLGLKWEAEFMGVEVDYYLYEHG